MPPHDWRAKLTFEENKEILVIVMEALCDLLMPHLVGIFILSFDLQLTSPEIGGYVCRVLSGR